MNNAFQTIKIESNNKNVYSIILNRPQKKNALNSTLISELTKAFNQLNIMDECRVIVLSSNSDCFCSGADLDDLKTLQEKDEKTNIADSEKLMNLYKSILYNTKLTISKVNGPAIAGGCGLATTCDIIFANENAKFGYSEVKIGFVPALVSVFLSIKVSESIAKELFLTGRIFDGKYAKKIGLINYLYENDIIDEKIDLFCDCLGMSGGWTPAVHLFTQSGGKLKFRNEDNVFIPNTYPSDQISIGACNGDLTLDEILKNTPNYLKKFLNIKNTEYENLEILSSTNKSNRNIWLLPSDKVFGKSA